MPCPAIKRAHLNGFSVFDSDRVTVTVTVTVASERHSFSLWHLRVSIEEANSQFYQ
jgi:hypothetical protein